MQRDDLAGHLEKKHGDKTSHRLWKWMKQRSGVEPGIGHLKQEHRLNGYRLAGAEGDMTNVILTDSGMNFHNLMRHLRAFWSWIYKGLLPSIQALKRQTTRVE